MEICIEKKLFLNIDIDVDENTTREEFIEKIKEEIHEHSDIEEWDELDWRGKEVYHVYETYGGTDITDIDL